MSGRYLYCQNPKCGTYLGSVGGNDCRVCEWVAEPEDEEPDQAATQAPTQGEANER